MFQHGQSLMTNKINQNKTAVNFNRNTLSKRFNSHPTFFKTTPLDVIQDENMKMERRQPEDF